MLPAHARRLARSPSQTSFVALLTRYAKKFASYAKYQLPKWQPKTHLLNGSVIVKCANPAFTKVLKNENDSNFILYPKYVRAYHS